MHKKYRKFENVCEAASWGKIHYSNWLPNYQVNGKLRGCYDIKHPWSPLAKTFSDEEKNKMIREALEYRYFSFYCGGNWGLAINEKLRFGSTGYTFPQNELIQMQKVMDKTLSIASTPENIWGYRFLDYKKLCISAQKAHINFGSVIVDKGYMGVGIVESTLTKEYDGYNTMLKILIPKGAKGLYLDLISNRCSEQEILFARGSRLRVLFRYRKKGKKIIICKLLK